MDAIEIEFNEVFKARGGRYDPSNLGEHGKIYQSAKRDFYKSLVACQSAHPNFPNVNIDFIDNSTLNAVAAKDKGKYYIGINAGVPFVLYDLFLRMMTSDKILPEIGDVKLETGVKKIWNPQLTDLKKIMLASDGKKLEPKSEQRNIFALFLTMTALTYLFDHEMGHLVNGHVDYLDNVLKVPSISKSQETSQHIDKITYQTLEMDADCFAFAQAIRALQHINSNKQIIEGIPLNVRPFFVGIEKGIYYWAFAIYSVFRLFGYMTQDESILKKDTHPPSGMRQRMMFGLIATLFEKMDNLNTITNQLGCVLVDVENAFSDISETEMNSDAIGFAFTDASGNHLRTIMRNWGNLRPLLLPYAYGVLAPVTNWD